MPTIHDTPPAPVQSDLNRLAQALDSVIPFKIDTNLLIATWNIRRFGSLTREWTAGANAQAPLSSNCQAFVKNNQKKR